MRKTIPIATLTLLTCIQLFPSSSAAENKSEIKAAFYHVKVASNKGKTESVATITTTGKGGFHCNTLYPWKLTLTPEPGVKVAKTTFKKKDAAKFSEKVVTFRVSYNEKPGKSIAAKLKLSVCDDKQCKMETVSLKW